MAPTAVATGLLAPAVGRIVDRSHPVPIVGFGFATLAIALTWLSMEMTPTTPMWRLVLPFAAMGVGMAFIWAPLAATATRNLPPDLAGAGSGVYNTTRQVGSVLGSASMAAFMTWRIGDELPPQPDGAAPRGEGAVTQLPASLHQPFSDAMSQSILLPAFVALLGVVAALFLLGARPARALPSGAARFGAADDDELDDFEPPTDEIPAIHEQYLLDEYGGAIFDDEDHDVVYELAPPEQPDDVEPSLPADDNDTEPLALLADPGHVELIQLQPKENYEPLYHDPPDSWMHSSVEPIGFAHNGFHVDREQRFRDVSDQRPAQGRHAARGERGYDWMDPDADSYGRHSMPAGD
jgi:Major Facilitator Superfamily